MKSLSCLLIVALASTATAQTYTGPGDLIPNDGSTGGGTGWDVNNLDHDLTLIPSGASIINIPVAVNGIDSVTVTGLAHTWIGDTHAVLRDPNGVGYNIWLRPEIEPGETCCGNSGDFDGGDYTFVEPGTSANGKLPEIGTPAAGDWDQAWDSNDSINPLVWPAPDEMVMNIPLSGIAGPAGDWTLTIYDNAGGDSGSFTGVEITVGGAPTCGAGSANSVGSGAVLSGTSGNFTITGIPDQPGVGYFGMSPISLPFGCGERCIGGTVTRLAPVFGSGNMATITDAVPSGNLLQFWYRDPANMGACGDVFNLSNVITVP